MNQLIQGVNVIIEGPNGSGKSSLADYVKNLLRYDQMNLAHRDGDQFRRYMSEYGRSSTVFCRAHWSEVVYSKLFGRAEPFTYDEYDCLTTAANLRSVVVLCLPESADVLRERYQARQVQGFGGVTIEKYEELGKEWTLWYSELAPMYAQHPADISYNSKDHADMLATAERIRALVIQRSGVLSG